MSAHNPTTNPAAPEGYFSKIELYPPDRPRRIDLTSVPGAPSVPPVMLKLAEDIQSTIRLVDILFEHNSERRGYFQQALHQTADTGLRGPNASVDNGLQNLKEIRNSIASDFVVIRHYYYWRYFRVALFVGLPGLLLGGLAYVLASIRMGTGAVPFGLEKHLTWVPHISDITQGFPVWVVLFVALFWIPAGVTLGIFVEFYFRVDADDLSYEQLVSINPGRWRVAEREINTILGAYLFACLMASSALQIGILNVSLNEFSSTKPYLSGLVGFVSGFAYSYVKNIIYKVKPEVVDRK